MLLDLEAGCKKFWLVCSDYVWLGISGIFQFQIFSLVDSLYPDIVISHNLKMSENWRVQSSTILNIASGLQIILKFVVHVSNNAFACMEEENFYFKKVFWKNLPWVESECVIENSSSFNYNPCLSVSRHHQHQLINKDQFVLFHWTHR